jgi:hypothetical protein
VGQVVGQGFKSASMEGFYISKCWRYFVLFFFASSLIGYYSGRQKAREYEESFEKHLEEMRKKGLINVVGKGGNNVNSGNRIRPFHPRPMG